MYVLYGRSFEFTKINVFAFCSNLNCSVLFYLTDEDIYSSLGQIRGDVKQQKFIFAPKSRKKFNPMVLSFRITFCFTR